MFGVWRFLLSCMVVCSHTWFDIFGRYNWLGAYAVFGFYVLSGFLMTRVLHETYGYGARPGLRFLANRFLRIYPAYWVALAMMAGFIALHRWSPVPGLWTTVIPVPVMPNDFDGWGRAVTLLFLDWDYIPNMLPPSWSLQVEFAMYILLSLGLSRSLPATLVWFLASAAWTLYALLALNPFPERYATVIGASLPFAAGALIHFLPEFPKRARAGIVLAGVFFANALLPGVLQTSPTGRWFYISLALAIAVTALLRDVHAFSGWRRVDRVLGDLAYPMFLVHPPVSYALLGLFPAAFATPRDWFLAALPATMLVSALLHSLVERPMESVRARVRGGKPRAR